MPRWCLDGEGDRREAAGREEEDDDDSDVEMIIDGPRSWESQ